MKPVKALFLLATLCMLLPLACKKSDNKPQTAAVSMTFKFNGTTVTPTLIIATYYKSQSSVQIAGSAGNQALDLLLQNPKAGASYDLSTDQTVVASYSTALDLDHTFLGTTGKIMITTFDSDTIAGTFSFSGVDGLGDTGAITGGTFSAKLITQ